MSQPAVGIDLGTTFSAIAAINPAGKPEIVTNKEGGRITDSAVYFPEDSPILIGQLAASAAEGDPDRVVRWIKREMGDPGWLFTIDDKTYSPVDISAMILKKIRQDAEAVLGPIQRAVVTVPAYFDEVRRKATMDAAAKAGLEVLRIINEPTAAALVYATTGRVRGTVLIYDFGGGTFDVSIVNIDSPTDIVVIASEGANRLGGRDLDEALAKHFDDLFHEEHKIRLMHNSDMTVVNRTLARAEITKRSLSGMPSVSGIPLMWKGQGMNVKVTRPVFEDLIGDHIVETEMLVENALSEAELSASDIDAVILAGGSTRIPAVQDMLRKKFGREPVCQVSPDEVVALGAAIQAGMIMQERGLIDLPEEAATSLSSTRLTDVTCHSYGTISIQQVHGREKPRNTIIIPRNSSIPCSETETFYTMERDQQAVLCRVTQCEHEDPEFAEILWQDSLALPPDRPAGREVSVTYTYDANGRMSCEFLDVESGRTKRTTLDIAGPSAKGVVVPELEEASFEDLVIE